MRWNDFAMQTSVSKYSTLRASCDCIRSARNIGRMRSLANEVGSHRPTGTRNWLRSHVESVSKRITCTSLCVCCVSPLCFHGKSNHGKVRMRSTSLTYPSMERSPSDVPRGPQGGRGGNVCTSARPLMQIDKKFHTITKHGGGKTFHGFERCIHESGSSGE